VKLSIEIACCVGDGRKALPTRNHLNHPTLEKWTIKPADQKSGRRVIRETTGSCALLRAASVQFVTLEPARFRRRRRGPEPAPVVVTA
jgi:hypothetical protein